LKKRYHVPAHELRELVPDSGSCIASDLILVDGHRIGFMYREVPDLEHDSGWRFFAGVESQDYVDEAANFAFYAINTVANYDEDIIPLLGSPVGSAFERDESGAFVAVPFPADPDSN